MKNIRIVLSALALAALAVTGYSLANSQTQPAGEDCCASGSACCSATSACCSK